MSDKFREYNIALINRGAWKEILPHGVDKGSYISAGDKYGAPGNSFYLYKDTGNWKDSATGETGDLISLFAEHFRLGMGETVEELNKRWNFMSTSSTTAVSFKDDKTDYFEYVDFGGELTDDYIMGLWRSKRSKSGLPDPEVAYKYFDLNGKFRFIIYRVVMGDGSKQFFPYSYGKKGRSEQVGWFSTISGERPLYNLINFDAAQSDCIIVEGEKCADLLQKYIGDRLNVISWSGGAQAVSKSRWEDLASLENALIIPDNDLPGENAARSIYNILSGKQIIKGRLIIANLPEDKPDKWDIGDLILELEAAYPGDEDRVRQEIVSFIKSVAIKVKHFKTDDNWLWPRNTTQITKDKKRFTCLGYAHKGKGYYFYSEITNTLVTLTDRDFNSKEKLWSLSPRDFWYDLYGLPSTREGGTPKLNMERIAESLITCCQEKGMVDLESIARDKGAFLDEGKIVIHLGDKTIVNGMERGLDLKSEFIYERQPDPMDIDTKSPVLTIEEAKDIWKTFDVVKFKTDLDLRFLMGWLFASVLCGIWEWRSHLWIMGESSAGKSKIKDAMALLLKDYKKDYQNPTEAAIRRALSRKYLPCFLDEFDKDINPIALQSVILLIRMNSTDSDSEMPRSQGDGIVEYKIRSMFCAVATLNPLKLIQDHNRYTIVNVLKSNNFELYDRTLGRVKIDWVAKGYPDKFLMRVFKFAKTMKEQELRFKNAIARKRVGARDADQLATITLGAWFFTHDHVPSDTELDSYIEGYDKYIVAKQDGLTSEFDECWSILSTYQVRLEYQHNGTRESFNTSIGYLIDYCLGVIKDGRLTRAIAEDKLNMYGIRIMGELILISNRHKNLERIFKGSNWDNKNWSAGFSRSPHAQPHTNTVRFDGGLVDRVTAIHIDFIINPDQEKLRFDAEDKEPF